MTERLVRPQLPAHALPCDVPPAKCLFRSSPGTRRNGSRTAKRNRCRTSCRFSSVTRRRSHGRRSQDNSRQMYPGAAAAVELPEQTQIARQRDRRVGIGHPQGKPAQQVAAPYAVETEDSGRCRNCRATRSHADRKRSLRPSEGEGCARGRSARCGPRTRSPIPYSTVRGPVHGTTVRLCSPSGAGVEHETTRQRSGSTVTT